MATKVCEEYDRKEYHTKIMEELQEEIEKSRKHCQYFSDNRDPREDLKNEVYRKLWTRWTELQEVLCLTLMWHEVKVQTKEGEIELKTVSEKIKIYYLFLYETLINLTPNVIEDLLEIQHKINEAYLEIRNVMEMGQ